MKRRVLLSTGASLQRMYLWPAGSEDQRHAPAPGGHQGSSDRTSTPNALPGRLDSSVGVSATRCVPRHTYAGAQGVRGQFLEHKDEPQGVFCPLAFSCALAICTETAANRRTQGCSSEALAKTKTEYDSFLADPSRLTAVREQLKVRMLCCGLPGCLSLHPIRTCHALHTPPARRRPPPAARLLLQRPDLSAEQRKVLRVMEHTFATYITEDPAAAGLKEKLNGAEAALAAARNGMALGYTDPATGACSGVLWACDALRALC